MYRTATVLAEQLVLPLPRPKALTCGHSNKFKCPASTPQANVNNNKHYYLNNILHGLTYPCCQPMHSFDSAVHVYTMMGTQECEVIARPCGASLLLLDVPLGH